MGADMLADAFEKLLEHECSAQVVREIESGASPRALWESLDQSGFADALVAESAGGSGLGLKDVFPMLLACGAHSMPLPLAFTMFARAVLAESGGDVPRGPIALALATPDGSGAIHCNAVPWGAVAESVLVDTGTACWMLPVKAGVRAGAGPPDSLAADLHWPDTTSGRMAGGVGTVRPAAVALLSGHIAGAMVEVLSRTLVHANERKQFGKSIGKFQAIQQQLAAMAQQVFAAHAAAETGCHGGWNSRPYCPAPLQAALAKARCSDAVVSVATTAHAVHGAMGVTQEFDLQLLTRRLHAWRLAYGGERYWQAYLGSTLLSRPVPILDFIRQELAS